MRRSIVLTATLLTTLPLLTSAATCPSLSRGSTGSSVTQLQQFLSTQYDNFPTATGYFGAVTEAAVRQWQREHNIISSGTPATTGYGAVGPKTAAAMKLNLCSGTTPSTNPTQALIDSLLIQLHALQAQLATLLAQQNPQVTTVPSVTTGGGGATTSGGSGGSTSSGGGGGGTTSSSAPTASFTINGSTNVTAKVGDTLHYAWSSTNAVSAKTTYTVDGAGPYDGGVNTLSGTLSQTIAPPGGDTTAFTYTVTDAQGRTASAQASVSVPLLTVYSVKDYGAKGDGVADDSTAIQQTINAARPDASSIAQVYVPCGTYSIGNTITLKSNMHFYGDGSCSLLKATVSIPYYPPFTTDIGAPNNSWSAKLILTNADYVNGNTNITIDHVALDFSAQASTPGTDNAHLRNVSNTHITSITTNGGNDGVAFTKSHDFTVTDSTLLNHNNADLDSWDGDYNYTYSGNTMDNANAVIPQGWPQRNDMGMIATGLTTMGQAATVTGVHFVNNIIRNTANGGIWIQGGYSSQTGQSGTVQNFEVSGNTIDGVSAYHGIRVSEGIAGTIVNNTIRNIAGSGVIILGEYTGATQSDITMSGNTLSNVDTTNGADTALSAFYMGAGSKRITVTGNTVSGSAQPYSFYADIGSSAITATGNTFSAGKFGTIHDAGTGNTISQ